jgi:hypothetical protein
MPILLLTETERAQLKDLLVMHIDGLVHARDEITTSEESMHDMLELTGTVDESVSSLTHVLEKVTNAI